MIQPNYVHSTERVLREMFPAAPLNIRIIGHFHWSSYEEGGSHFVVEGDDGLFCVGHDSSVFSNDPPFWRPEILDEAGALARMIEWEAAAAENETDGICLACCFEMP